MAVPFLTKASAFTATHPNATLRVQWAPNSFLPDPTGWAWIDITSDVMIADGRNIQISPMGKSDAAQQIQPAGCSFYLDNRSGNYSKGPQSAYYPNLTLNIPIRVQVSLNGVSYFTRFQGYTSSLRPEWDETGQYAVTRVTASGVSRRLQHGVPALKSPVTRAFLKDTDVVSYWPMEEAAGATILSQALPTGADLKFNGLTLGEYDGIVGSAPLPVFTSSGRISGTVSYDFSGNWEVDFLFYMPNIPAADTAVLRIHTGGSQITRWELVWTAASSTTVAVKGYDNSATIVVNDSANMVTTVGIPISCRFMAKQNGAATDYQFVVFPAAGGSGAVNTGSVAATTVGDITEISNLAATGMVDSAMGHIVVMNTYNNAFPDGSLTGWTSDGSGYVETPYGRINALLEEESVDLVEESTSGVEYMGAQGRSSLMDILREAEVVDGGILWDGYGPGFNWKSLQDILAQTASLTLATTDLVPQFTPEDDDQEVVNSMTVKRADGGEANYTDATSNMGTAAIGYYESSQTVNVYSDDRLRDFAAWAVHLGTVDGYRFPEVNLDLRRIPSKASAWLATDPGSRVTVQTIENWVSQMPNGDVDLLMLGYTETLSNFEWSATLNCAPWVPYEVPILDDASDTYDARAGWLDTDGHTLSASASAGATSLSVATAAGNPLWSTSALDVPVYISVGGYRVQLTAVSGASSPQTFTVSALPAAVSSGGTVSLWYPDYLSI